MARSHVSVALRTLSPIAAGDGYDQNMQLVILASGHGGHSATVDLLSPVGPEGETLIDYTALDAIKCGFKKIIVVAPTAVKKELTEHFKEHWPERIDYDLIVHRGVAGTAQAVRSAARLIDGPFGVANAEDYYGPDALEQLCIWLESAATEPKEVRHLIVNSEDPVDPAHVLFGFRLADTVLSTDTVTRGICRTNPAGDLVDIVEQNVTRVSEDGSAFAGAPAESEPGSPAQPLSGDELASMNLWGFYPRLFDHLAGAVKAFDPPEPTEGDEPPDLLLPEVVMGLVRSGVDRVRVIAARGQVIGVTNPGDLAVARREMQDRHPGHLLAPNPDTVPKNVT